MDDELDFEEEPDLLEGDDTNIIEDEELLIQDEADMDDETADIDDNLDQDLKIEYKGKYNKWVDSKNNSSTWNDEEDNLSEFFVGLINKWKLSNPDFEHRYYSSDRLSFIKENFEEKVYRAYCRIIKAYKADLWRYCILYNYGGFYVDIDTLAIGSLKPLLKKILI